MSPTVSWRRFPPNASKILLRTADELVELRDRVVVGVVVDPAEAHEHGNRGPELGEELAAAGPHSLVDGREQPFGDDVVVERLLEHDQWRFGTGRAEPRDDGTHPSGLRVEPLLAHVDAVAERLASRLLEHDLSPAGQVLGGGELVDQASRKDVDAAGSRGRRRGIAAPRRRRQRP